MAMEKDSISSKNETDHNIDGCTCTEASRDTQPRGEGEDSKLFDDVSSKKYLCLVDSGSTSVSGGAGIISDEEKKQRVESLKMKPIMMKKVEKTRVIKLFGVDIYASTDSEYATVYDPKPLRCFNPNTANEFVPEQSHDPLDQQRGGHVENTEQALNDFSRLLQNIEARFGVRPVLLYQKKLTKSDVSSKLNRLFITRSQELMGFLRDEERRRVNDDDKKIWLDVLITVPTGEIYELNLKMWHSLNMVVLNGRHWNTLVSKNKLEAGYSVELWAYRERDNEFRLAMNFKNAE